MHSLREEDLFLLLRINVVDINLLRLGPDLGASVGGNYSTLLGGLINVLLQELSYLDGLADTKLVLFIFCLR